MNVGELPVDKTYIENAKDKVEFMQGVFSNKINLEPNVQGNMSARFKEISARYDELEALYETAYEIER
ncbi:5056_t:CDS:1, partial [Funneliformis caledonium]